MKRVISRYSLCVSMHVFVNGVQFVGINLCMLEGAVICGQFWRHQLQIPLAIPTNTDKMSFAAGVRYGVGILRLYGSCELGTSATLWVHVVCTENSYGM